VGRKKEDNEENEEKTSSDALGPKGPNSGSIAETNRRCLNSSCFLGSVLFSKVNERLSCHPYKYYKITCITKMDV
jgi:hypothetical protein